MFLHMSVILSTGGVWPQCILGYLTPLEQAPPGPGTPQSRHPLPLDQTPSLDQTHPLLGAEPPPPCTVHAGRYGQQAGGMHPTGMQSCCMGQ